MDDIENIDDINDDLVAMYGQGRALTTTDEYIDSLYPTLITKPQLTLSQRLWDITQVVAPIQILKLQR